MLKNTYTRNVTKKQARKSVYRFVAKWPFENVTFESAAVLQSVHPANKVAFLVVDNRTGKRLIVLEFTEREARIMGSLMEMAITSAGQG